MCKEDSFGDIVFCEKWQLKNKIERMVDQRYTTTQGHVLFDLGTLKNILKTLDCTEDDELNV